MKIRPKTPTGFRVCVSLAPHSECLQGSKLIRSNLYRFNSSHEPSTDTTNDFSSHN